MNAFSRLLTILALAGLSAMPAMATSVLPIDAPQAVDQAELIFTGQVLTVEFATSHDGRFPYTFVTFAIDETLKGSAEGEELTLRFDGGDLVETRESVEVLGMPTFEVGDQVLLFVAGNGKAGCPVVGWWQGRLDFVQHPSARGALLVDHRGAPVEGAGMEGWRHGELRYDRTEKRLVASESGAQLLWTEGVTIDDGREAKSGEAYAGVPAAKVIDELRQLVDQRRRLKSFTAEGVVSSASPLDVPYSVLFTAVGPTR